MVNSDEQYLADEDGVPQTTSRRGSSRKSTPSSSSSSSSSGSSSGRGHIASPAKLRASRVGYLLLCLSLVLFGYGYFGDALIRRSTTLPSGQDQVTTYGLWRQSVTVVDGDVTTIVITPLDKVRPEPPSYGTYKETAGNVQGLGGTGLALGLASVLLGLLVVFSLGTHYVDVANVVVVFLGCGFMVLALVVYDGKRPKGSDGKWDDYELYTSAGLAIAGTAVMGVSFVLFLLGKR